MPAHQPLSAIATAVLSNGKLLSGVDWRANRLVDALAKQAAATMRTPVEVRSLLESGQAAVKHHSAVLGVATHAANNHEMAFQRPDGTMGFHTIRDAQQPSRHSARRMRQTKPPAEPKPLPDVVVSDLDEVASGLVARPTKRQRVASAARQRKRRAVHGSHDRLMLAAQSKQPLVRRCRRPACEEAGAGWSFEAGFGLAPPAVSRTTQACSDRPLDSMLPGLQNRSPDAWPQTSRPALDPEEELGLMSRCGLKICWPRCDSAGASGSNADAPALVVPVSTVVQRAHSTTSALSAEDQAALQDLQSLHEGGLQVVWPRGHGPCKTGR